MPQFPVMQFQPGQGPYYHQFLVSPGVQMPPLTIIPPIRNMQGEEGMDIPGQSTVMQLPQRPQSAANPDYISPLKRDTEIGQPGRDHSGQRH
uniref:Ameloblastin n=1 Tax=Romanomermis culicivorax TaxID=13658 RepID=A0A915IB79_ROMCU